MAKKRPSTASFSNWNNMERTDSMRQGTKLTAEPTSVADVLTLVIIHGCKKSIFFNIRVKVAVYLLALFFISLIADFVPVPKSYFSHTGNVLNQYFVKFAWGWNFILLVPFVLLTSLVGSFGDIKLVLRRHLPRILIATAFWYILTKLVFQSIEANYGRCTQQRRGLKLENSTPATIYETRNECLLAGHNWYGFDISGHCFILIYGSLVLIEEASAIVGWENIKDFIRFEEHYRASNDRSPSTNPLRNITKEQLNIVKFLYGKLTPYVYLLFVLITGLQVLWDVMLVATLVYYHIMVEKFIGGACAILLWYFNYRFLYQLNIEEVVPNPPGKFLFKFNEKLHKRRSNSLIRGTRAGSPSTTSRNASSSSSSYFEAHTANDRKNLPKFMGMPLYGLRNQKDPTSSGEEPLL